MQMPGLRTQLTLVSVQGLPTCGLLMWESPVKVSFDRPEAKDEGYQGPPKERPTDLVPLGYI